MIVITYIEELTIIGTHDRGVPNNERIVFQANSTIDLGRYGLLLGLRGDHGAAIPVHDNFFWFGDVLINPGDWIFVYTGPGDPRLTELPNSNNRIYTLHWGRSTTVLHDINVVPILFRIDGVAMPSP